MIWEVRKKKNKWITLNNETILILEEAYKKDPNSVVEKGKIKVQRICTVTVDQYFSIICQFFFSLL